MRVLEVVSPGIGANLGANKYYKDREGAIDIAIGCWGNDNR